jgi:hypothetical protein
MSPRFRRILIITAALAGLGAVVGAVLGALVIAGIMIVPRPRFPVPPTAVVIGAGFGAAAGFVLTPIAAWTLMRRVPLWRAIADTAVGTAIGAGVGLLLQSIYRVADVSPLLLGVVGFAAAALRLRLFYRRPAAKDPAQRIV